jgi:predicted nucleotidyltransferase
MRTGVLRPTGAFILQSAIHYLAARQRTTEERLLGRLRDGEGELHAQFRLAIARMLYIALHPEQEELRSLHVFGSSVDQDARPASDLDLLVHVADPHCPLIQELHELDEEISQAYRELMQDKVPPSFSLLSIHVVTDDQVERRHGLASILSSIHMQRYRLGPPTAC